MALTSAFHLPKLERKSEALILLPSSMFELQPHCFLIVKSAIDIPLHKMIVLTLPCFEVTENSKPSLVVQGECHLPVVTHLPLASAVAQLDFESCVWNTTCKGRMLQWLFGCGVSRWQRCPGMGSEIEHSRTIHFHD